MRNVLLGSQGVIDAITVMTRVAAEAGMMLEVGWMGHGCCGCSPSVGWAMDNLVGDCGKHEIYETCDSVTFYFMKKLILAGSVFYQI